MKNRKILIVDNRDEFIEECSPKLTKRGFDVFSANSYNEALKKFDEVDPDFVLTALMLEHFDSGFVLSYKLKNKKPKVPIYILTTATHSTGIKFSTNTGEQKKWILADGFLNEPIEANDLIDIIEKSLEQVK
ncbi:MAG TPA: hypothetical protein DHW82_06985 [Spirochaetia bacterium]|nr:MAG: hypothetical protein A2Y41_03680 [Spirochaetes bacterium GWB1_36_13]HCL56738.1 hypothetical protein [Spirochaetia bacterium]